MTITAIDPGTSESAILNWDGKEISHARIMPNAVVLDGLRSSLVIKGVAVEMIASYGMPVGREVFETCLMVGRIQEICAHRGMPCRLVYRLEVKQHHCHNGAAKDSNIRQALIDRFGAPGVKANQGATYGLKSHLWAAFAVASYAFDKSGAKEV